MNVVKLESKEDIQNIFKWKDEHPDEIRKGYNPMQQVEISMDSYNSLSFRCFRNKDRIQFYVNLGGNPVGHFVITKLPSGLYKVVQNKRNMKTEFIGDLVTLYFSLMALFVVGSNYVDVETVQEAEPKEKQVASNHSKLRKKKSSSVCYIVRRKSRERKSNGEKRAYTKHAGTFDVRGHYRHYKSGKTVWVNEYEKGTGKKKSEKTYKLGNIEVEN